ncbi:putative RNA-binding Zn-ribbon protein involved in translation (DUF1610 family) [Paenibacillus sp. V4I3]|uniref:TnsD family Tn7-like transposition protein n=1 Tax=Paenibacillus sp. V4I3 TaxID=3042305 RepID=UPI002782930B|nr:TnsD family Tn7-like transposition protein [Paenibacillus sp. V4I3]MDQ0871358.1 putative RNA-binding Zn-ribbon protein involved in translation (DUF1610 family) [Paenibacillus sp. V4I3]
MDTLIYFPILYPNEDLRSIIIRYHRDSINGVFLHSKFELFSVNTFKNEDVLPRNMELLFQKLCFSYDEKQHFIDNHTYLPFIKPFITIKEFSKILTNPSLRCNYSINNLVNPIIRYCPMCIWEDEKIYKEIYVHRSHQLYFLSSCPTHHISLITNCRECDVPFAEKWNQKLISLPQCSNNHPVSHSEHSQTDVQVLNIYDSLIKISKRSSTLHAEEILNRLLTYAGLKEYLHFKGAVHKRLLLNDLFSFYGEDVYSILGITRELVNSQYFLTEFMTINQMAKYIPFYISIILFFAQTINEFLDTTVAYSYPLPFGCGPWPCVNRICPQHGPETITFCKRYIHDYVSGSFTCPVCGMSYFRQSKYGVENEGDYSIDDMGFLWKNTVDKLYSSGHSITQIIEVVQSKRHTISKHLDTKHKSLYIKFNRFSEDYEQKKIDLLKQDLVKLLDLQKGLNRKQIRESLGHRGYNLLMKHEKIWMELILPSRKDRKDRPNQLNFDSLDNELLIKVQNLHHTILIENPMRSISKHSIIRRLSKNDQWRLLSTEKKRSKLPKTIKYLDGIFEAKEDYQKRIFPKVVEKVKNSGKTLTVNSIRRYSKAYKNCSPHLEEWLKAQILNIPS